MRNKSNLPGVLVVAGSILLMFAMWGMGNHPLGLYVVPVTAAYGFSRTSFSVVFSIINLCNALGCLFFGTALKKLGLRRLMICGAALGILGYALLAAASDLAVFYIASAVFGVALAMTTNNPISQLINKLVSEKTGRLVRARVRGQRDRRLCLRCYCRKAAGGVRLSSCAVAYGDHHHGIAGDGTGTCLAG